MKEIKKNAKIKSKVKGKETPFNVDLNYSEQYDSFNIKVKKGEGFMSYTDSLQSLPLEVVQKLNEMLEEVLIKAGSETEMKEHKMFDGGGAVGNYYIVTFGFNGDEGYQVVKSKPIFAKSENEAELMLKDQFESYEGQSCDIISTKKQLENGGDFQTGVYAKGGSLEAHGIKEGDTFIKTISGVIQKVRDKDGKIVYINLANGERDSQPPLPFNDGGEVKQKIESKNFSELKQGDVIRRKDSLGTTIFVVNSSAKQNRLYKNEYDLVATCIVSTHDFYKPFEEYSVKTIIKYGKLPNVDYLGKWNYDQKIDYSKYLPKSRNKYDDGGEVTYFVNKDGIRVRSVAKPDKELTEKEWIAKHNESKEARAYKRGGALIGNQKRIDMNHNGEIDAEDFKLLRSSMNGAWRNERKHVNHKEDYEVRYARPRANRTGYKGKRNFEIGGMMSKHYSTSRATQTNKGNFNRSITNRYNDGGKVTFKEKSIAYAKGGKIRVGDVLKKKDGGLEVKVIDVGNDWRSGKDYITIYQDVTNSKVTLVDWSDYEKVETAKMNTGGKVTFKEKSSAIARNFVGKRVEPKYQKEYGKTYDAKEAKEVGNKIAGSQKAKYDAKAEKGAVVKKKSGNPKMKEAMVLAKKIRKDGEKWTDAVKRAYAQIK